MGVRLDEVASRMDELRPAHEEYLRLELMLGEDPPGAGTRATSVAYRGVYTLTAFVDALMADAIERTLDQVERAVRVSSEFQGRQPTRSTIAARLDEMSKPSGSLDGSSDGRYRCRLR